MIFFALTRGIFSEFENVLLLTSTADTHTLSNQETGSLVKAKKIVGQTGSKWHFKELNNYANREITTTTTT